MRWNSFFRPQAFVMVGKILVAIVSELFQQANALPQDTDEALPCRRTVLIRFEARRLLTIPGLVRRASPGDAALSA
jgi:hypothetical protein